MMLNPFTHFVTTFKLCFFVRTAYNCLKISIYKSMSNVYFRFSLTVMVSTCFKINLIGIFTVFQEFEFGNNI